MKLTAKVTPAVALILLAVLPASFAGGSTVAVPVVNPSFEADALSPGEDAPSITGWLATAGGGDGVFRPTASQYPGGVPDGVNVAYVNNPGNFVRQVLGTPLASNTRYVLTVEVGWRADEAFAGYTVQLRAGGEVLAEDPSTQSPAQGTFVTSTVEAVVGAAHPQLGEPLEIHLLAPGVQANFDDVRLTAEHLGVCSEIQIVPFHLADVAGGSGVNTLFAVRNLTDVDLDANVEYFTLDGTSQRLETLTLGPNETRTVSLRDVPGLGADGDGFRRGFVRIAAAGHSDGTPVLAGDFFQVDTLNNFATGDRLVRQSDLCRSVSIRFLDFGAGTRLLVFVADPRGLVVATDPPSFTVQAYDEAGNALGGPQPVWTDQHALELAASDFTVADFGSLRFDFSNSLGGAVYAEYSAEGRFSVGAAGECEDAPSCAPDCCPPGSATAVTPPIHYPAFEDCTVAGADALSTLDSSHYRNACQQAFGGPLPDTVLGLRLLTCEIAPPGFPEGTVVTVEVCCPEP